MGVKRLDNVSIVFEDLDRAVEFFLELGLEEEGRGSVEGQFVDDTLGIDGARSQIAMLRTPDGHSKLELARYLHPAAIPSAPPAPNTVGFHRLMFAVDDIHDTLARIERFGAKPLRTVANYEDIYLLCYVRGPEGIVIGLAQEVS